MPLSEKPINLLDSTVNSSISLPDLSYTTKKLNDTKLHVTFREEKCFDLYEVSFSFLSVPIITKWVTSNEDTGSGSVSCAPEHRLNYKVPRKKG